MGKKLNAQERKVVIIGILSLLAAVVTYGILSSTGAFNNKVWNLGGAIVGFLASVFAFNRVYGKGFLKDQKKNDYTKPAYASGLDVSATLIEGSEEIINLMIQIVLNAHIYIYTIGGRSRDDAYLDALNRRLLQKDIHHIRILTGDYIHHSLCRHLQETLDCVELGHYDKDRFGNVLVTHDTTFIALPSPEGSILEKGILISGERIASDYRSYITELLGGSDKDKRIDSNFIMKLCMECRRENN